MTKYNKLVRDKIPEFLDSKGIAYEKRIATIKEYRKRLLEKLVEEVKEFFEAQNVEELADVLEVIETIKKLPEFTKVEKIRRQKLAERGGFEKRIILKGKK